VRSLPYSRLVQLAEVTAAKESEEERQAYQLVAYQGYLSYLLKGPSDPHTFDQWLSMLKLNDKPEGTVALPKGVEYDTASTPEEIMRKYGGRLPRKQALKGAQDGGHGRSG
jgi:hypothetical protein